MSGTIAEKIYCRHCGSKLEEHKSGRFDTQTGEALTEKHCPNLNCTEGCEYAGHKYGSFFLLQHETCKRCGFVVWHDDY